MSMANKEIIDLIILTLLTVIIFPCICRTASAVVEATSNGLDSFWRDYKEAWKEALKIFRLK